MADRHPNLIYVSDDEPGIARIGRARPRYLDRRTGKPARSNDLARIRALAVPPAWTDVWICPDPDGHVQATGRDARGRKQYRYHADFRAWRERQKFRSLAEFGLALGDLRAKVDEDLSLPGLPAERVVAAVVAILEQTFVRVGNEEYARSNRTFGLTTLRSKHVQVDGSTLAFCFVGKGGKRIEVTCSDPRLGRVVRRCQGLPGQVLFQYVDEAGEVQRVTSTDVNAYLRDETDLDVTAKTFRTWGASVLAGRLLAAIDPPGSTRATASALREVLTDVADRLGNTVAVCRASYVHPEVIRRFERGDLADGWAEGPSRAGYGLTADERRLLVLLGARAKPRRVAA